MTTQNTALQRVDQNALVVGGAPLPMQQEFETLTNMAAYIFKGRLFGNKFQSVEAVVTTMLLGRDLGISPMAALQKSFVIEEQGRMKVDFETDVKLQVVQSRIPDFRYEVVTWNDKVCRLKGGRQGGQQVEIEVTLEMAISRKWATDKEGKLKKAWANNAQDMLFWRTITRILKLTSAGVLYGAAVPVMLLAVDDDDDREPVEGRATVLADGPGPQSQPEAGNGAKDGAQAAPVVVEQLDAKTAALGRIWKLNGTKDGSKALRSINALFSERGMKPVKREIEVATTDWKWMWERLDASYDEEGKPRENRPDPQPAAQQAAHQQSPDAPDADDDAPPAGEPEPSEAAERDPLEFDPEVASRAVKGDASALVSLGTWFDGVFGARGIAAIKEMPGDATVKFFTHGEVLRRVGGECVAMKNGKQAAVSKLLVGHADHPKPEEDLVAAIAYKFVEFIGEVQAETRANGLTAKQREAHRGAAS